MKKSTAVARTGRRLRVAEGLLAGKSVTEIARSEKVSRRTACYDVASRECQLFIDRVVDQRFNRVVALVDKALDAIEAALVARRVFLVRTSPGEKKAITLRGDAGADHYVRLTAVRCLQDLLLAGRPIPKPVEEPQEDKAITFEQFKRLLDRHTKPETDQVAA